MNFIKAAFSSSTGPKPRPWNKAAFQIFERLRTVPTDRLQRQLSDISAALDSSFEYGSQPDACAAMECFLEAWNHILACVEEWSTQLRALCLDVVAKFAARDEFCISHIRLDREGRCPSNPRRRELLCCYASVLRTTQAWAGDRMLLWQPVQEFCARILAISQFRLPEIHSLVCAALTGVEALSVNQALSVKHSSASLEDSPELSSTPPASPSRSSPAAAPSCSYYRIEHSGLVQVQLSTSQPEDSDGEAEALAEAQAHAEAQAIAAANAALARAEAAQARALDSPAQKGVPEGFLQLWWHLAGERRGSSNTHWLSQCFTVDSTLRSQNFFCTFLTSVAAQASSLLAKGFSVPGAEAVEAAAISRLKHSHPKNYPGPLVEACSAWLRQQPQSLDCFLEAALSQMNVHNTGTVTEAVRYMKMWLCASVPLASAKVPRLPDGVRLEFMNQAIHVLLSCESFQVSLRTIVFLYDHINMLPFDARAKLISTVLLEKNFFRLFLHWLSEVRTFFCNLLVYKLFRNSRFDVFRELQEMDHLKPLGLQVPAHLGHSRTNDTIDEEKMQDFCLMAKFAFYLGTPVQHMQEPCSEPIQVGEIQLGPQQLVYSAAAITQLRECIEESYEWGLDECPAMLPKGMMAPR